MEIGIPLLVLAAVLAAIGIVLNRRSPSRESLVASPAEELDVVRPRPRVAEFHVKGDEAHVAFDVPLPADGADEVLVELLVAEAVEVVREKRHTLPIDGVVSVVAFAGSDRTRVGSVDLDTPGELPAPTGPVGFDLRLSGIGPDPLDQQFERDAPGQAPSLAEVSVPDELSPIGNELRIPRAVDVGLRSQGIDPATMSSGDMVRGMLTLYGYRIESTADESTYRATKAGATTFVHEVGHGSGDHPEIGESDITAFKFAFLDSKSDRGLLVSDKYAPFEIYDEERREPRIRFVTRERLQRFVDALALD